MTAKKKPAKVNWTERMLYKLIAKKYEQPACVCLPQVANATGWSAKQTRYADAIAMSLWPSRGLLLHGFEIKVSKSDWRSELRDPAKSEAIQSFMHHWWIVAPPGIVDKDDLPATWGLLVPDKRKRLLVKKKAPILKPKPVDYPFLAAMLRRVADHATPDAVLKAEREKGFTDGFRKGSDGWEKNYQKVNADLVKLTKRVYDFERVSGVKIEERWGSTHSAAEIGQAVRAILDGDQEHHRSFKFLRDRAAAVVTACDQVLESGK